MNFIYWLITQFSLKLDWVFKINAEKPIEEQFFIVEIKNKYYEKKLEVG